MGTTLRTKVLTIIKPHGLKEGDIIESIVPAIANPGYDHVSVRRDIFDELVDGLEACKAYREGKTISREDVEYNKKVLRDQALAMKRFSPEDTLLMANNGCNPTPFVTYPIPDFREDMWEIVPDFKD